MTVFLGSPVDLSDSLLYSEEVCMAQWGYLGELEDKAFSYSALVPHFRSCLTAVLLKQKVTHRIKPLKTTISADGELILMPFKHLWVSNCSCTQRKGKNSWIFLLQPQLQQAPTGRQRLRVSLQHLPWSDRDTLSNTSERLQLTSTRQTTPHIRIWLRFRAMTHFGRLASGGSYAPAYN